MNKRAILCSIVAVAALGLVSGSVLADHIIATNAGITSSNMDDGTGAAGDMAVYVYDNHTKEWTTAINVGNPYPTAGSQSYVRLEIRNGATISTTVSTFYVGQDDSSDHNKVLVTGTGTSLTTKAIRVGDYGDYNNLTVQSGATVSTGSFYAGYQAGGDYNSIVVDGGSLSTSADLRVCYNASAYNTLSISNGGTVSVTGSLTTRYGNNANISVTGAESTLALTGTLKLGEGASTNGSHDVTVTMANSGLIKLSNSLGAISTTTDYTTNPVNNYLQFNQGYLAWNGNHTPGQAFVLDVERLVQLWDGTQYVAATSANQTACGWSVTYYTADAAGEAAALTATGYSGLGGYTVFTGGIPEPTTMAMLAIGGIGVLVHRRRR